ncbi:MAG TPA: hypothetical protein VNT03_09060 [Baekduia sp.]|nr:hypothetical protein [Baekduia sp.]
MIAADRTKLVANASLEANAYPVTSARADPAVGQRFTRKPTRA